MVKRCGQLARTPRSPVATAFPRELSPVSRDKYAALRARGHKPGHALRVVGDRLLNVACVMLTNGTVFDPDRARARAT